MSRNSSKVFVAMSGGVDSSVAAWLLKNQGYEVTGVFMRCVSGELSRTTGGSPSTRLRADCTTEVDATDARRVAEKLEIPFYVWDFEEEYKRRVVDYMIDGYRRGLTPNPDVMCNREIKFGIFFERALRMGADYIATGHYVKLVVGREVVSGEVTSGEKLQTTNYKLLAARDAQKDQSYFLWTLTQKKLEHCLFPIGDYQKPEVREMARKAGLPTAEKKDSQGICFLGKITLSDFLAEYIPERSGTVLTDGGKKVGEHRGAEFYTIGQRHGLDLKSKNSELGIKGKYETKPHYVSEKNVSTNTIVVAEAGDPALYKKEMVLDDLNFINPLPSDSLRVLARVRYRQPLVKAILAKSGGGTYGLTFDAPQKFVAPGQSAVFYIEDPSAHSMGSRQAGSGRNPSQGHSTLRVSGVRPEDSAPSTAKSSGLNSPRDSMSSGFRMMGGGIIL